MAKKKKKKKVGRKVRNKTELFLWVKENTKEHVRKMAEIEETTMSKYAESLLIKDMNKKAGKAYTL